MSAASRARAPGAPSGRITSLLAGDLPDHRLERDDGVVSFVPTDGGPVINVWSRAVKRFLGRTEIAVFEVAYGGGPLDDVRIELRHAGAIRRSGLDAVAVGGGEVARALAGRINTDARMGASALPLDFTRFAILGGASGWSAEVELVGASHVAIALPPMRSYVRLHADQRQAMVGSLTRLGELIGGL